MYTSLFLDLDNTLLDFNKAEAHAIRKVLDAHGLPSDESAVLAVCAPGIVTTGVETVVCAGASVAVSPPPAGIAPIAPLPADKPTIRRPIARFLTTFLLFFLSFSTGFGSPSK